MSITANQDGTAQARPPTDHFMLTTDNFLALHNGQLLLAQHLHGSMSKTTNPNKLPQLAAKALLATCQLTIVIWLAANNAWPWLLHTSLLGLPRDMLRLHKPQGFLTMAAATSCAGSWWSAAAVS